MLMDDFLKMREGLNFFEQLTFATWKWQELVRKRALVNPKANAVEARLAKKCRAVGERQSVGGRG